ncbi:hypothetical protein DFQ26_001209, partial [Actinomortierella ambigua]
TFAPRRRQYRLLCSTHWRSPGFTSRRSWREWSCPPLPPPLQPSNPPSTLATILQLCSPSSRWSAQVAAE